MLREGSVLDRYRIESELGAGGMGRVFRAFDTRLQRHIALKVLLTPVEVRVAVGAEPATLPSDGAGAESVARLLREARAVAALNHPNVVAVYDVGEAGGVPFIAMEFVSGRNLACYVGDRAVPWQERLRWLADTARALGAAHCVGIVHRDIKPANVLVRLDGAVKVLDFGIARLGGGQETSTLAEATISGARPIGSFGTATTSAKILGTPQYMAPEQIRREPLDGRTDQFAWAVMAYELLTGRSPWESTSALSAISEILSRQPPPLRSLAPEVPPAVEAAVGRAMSKGAEDRFATMEDLLAALEPFVASTGAPGSRALLVSGASVDALTGVHSPSPRPRSPSEHLLDAPTMPAPPPDFIEQALTLIDPRPVSSPSVRPPPPPPSLPPPPPPPAAPAEPVDPADGVATLRPSSPDPRSSSSGLPVSDPDRRASDLEERPTEPDPLRRFSRPPRRAVTLALLGVLGLAAAGGTAFWSREPSERPPPPPPPAAPLAPAPTTLADLPEPQGCTPEAKAVYQKGLRLLREGNYEQAARRFVEAAESDTGCAVAHARTAISGRYFIPAPRVHAAYQRAMEERGGLSDRDRALLEAYEPILLRNPPDRDQLSARLLQLVARYPADAELLMLASAESRAPVPERLDYARRSAAIDPQYSDAWQNLGKLLALSGQEPEALQAIDSCLKASPMSTDCLWQRMAMHRSAGRCKAMEDDARAVINRSQDTPHGYATLAAALAAQDSPAESVGEVLKQRWAKLPPAEVEQERLLDQLDTAAFAGDFDALEGHARRLTELTEGSDDRSLRVRPLRLLLEAHLEADRTAETKDLVAGFVKRRRAWGLQDGVLGLIFGDHIYDEPRLLALAHETGALPPAAWREEIGRWRDEALLSSNKLDAATVWAVTEAMPARNAAEAAEALAAFPGGLSAAPATPASFRAAGFPAVFTGRALLLAGRPAEAESYLQLGAASCTALDDAFIHTRAHLWLGEALERKGDRDGACKAYGVVTRRWGRARPGSSTARAARKRLDALRCRDASDAK